jgi:hypothetical protein
MRAQRVALISKSAEAILMGKSIGRQETSNFLGGNAAESLKPTAMDFAALHGIAGEIVRTIVPHTESDQAALLVQLLVALGVLLERNAYYLVEGSRHHTNLFSVVVGCTSKGRKGTGLARIIQVLTLVSNNFVDSNMKSGLSTGEGLIHHVRDPLQEQQPIKEKGRVVDYQSVMVDAGIEDKRLLVTEPEFARTLKAADRESNTLSAVIRQAWDSGSLSVLTKQNGEKATGAHIGIAAHITRDELLRHLSSTESANGFANRFLWVHSERSKLLPFGGSLSDDELNPFAERLQAIQGYARTCRRITFDGEAADDWQHVYAQVSEGKPGLVGAVTGRAEAQVVRLALLYAVLDKDSYIRRVHLQAALAVWDYCDQSAEFIFGNALGDKTADAILAHLRSVGSFGATRTEINNLFSGNKPAAEIARALNLLQSTKKAGPRREPQGTGAPVERWLLRSHSDELNELNEISAPEPRVNSFNSLLSSGEEHK